MSEQQKLISFERGAEILGLHHTTIRQRKAGTGELTHVRGLGRRVMLIESEVLALAERMVDESKNHERERKTLLRLAS